MNTFGSTKQQFALCDPREIRANRQRFRRDAVRLLARANSFYCPSGRWPSRGWVLLPRYEYNQLVNYSTSLQLTVDRLPPLTNLSMVHAQCVTRGLASDPNALYLIEVTDDRGVLWNSWFQCPTVSQYNVRAPAYPGNFYSGSTNSGIAWTWNTMVQDLWNQLNAVGGGGIVLGNYPGLPINPTGQSVTCIKPRWNSGSATTISPTTAVSSE